MADPNRFEREYFRSRAICLAFDILDAAFYVAMFSLLIWGGSLWLH